MSIAPLLGKINAFILNPLIALLFSVALVIFLWGLIKFISTADTEDGRIEGKKAMIWGIVGLFIMFSVFGILRFILVSFGIPTPSYWPGQGITPS